VADVDLVVEADRPRALDALAVDERAVGRAEVFDVELTVVIEDEARVIAGDASLRKHEIIGGHAANPDLGLVLEALDPRRLALIRDPDSHADPAGPSMTRLRPGSKTFLACPQLALGGHASGTVRVTDDRRALYGHDLRPRHAHGGVR
jgi:hypothetical protein